MRQYYWRTDAPCANSNGGPNMKKNYWPTVPGQHCLLAEGDIGAPIYWRTDAPRAITIGWPMVSLLLLADRTVRLAYFQANRLLTGLYKQERKYVEEKMTATLKIKQTSIATVRNHILSVACFLTPLPFHYPLPLTTTNDREIFVLPVTFRVAPTHPHTIGTNY